MGPVSRVFLSLRAILRAEEEGEEKDEKGKSLKTFF
jgi:hypothetical protein